MKRKTSIKRSGFLRKTLAVLLAVSCAFACSGAAWAEEESEEISEEVSEEEAEEVSEEQADNTFESSSLLVGASVKDITPTEEMFPLTRAPQVTLSGLVLDEMHVRVIALSDGETTSLMICTETGRSMGPQYAQAVADYTGLPLENIVMTSTHSHAVPEVTEDVDLDFEDGDDVETLQLWAKYTMDQMLDAVDEAMDAMQPASVGVSYGESYINVNRNSEYVEFDEDGNAYETVELGYYGPGVSDKTVAAIQFNDSEGNPIAFIINYAVHNTVMHANTLDDGDTAISADIAGLVSSYIEENNDGAVAMWISGAAGDQNPIVQNDVYTRDPVTGEFEETFNGDYLILEYLAKIHYADVERTIESITDFTTDASISCEYLETSIPASEGSEDDEYAVGLQMLRIGDIGLACFSGELFSTIGLDMKDAALLPDTLVVNNCWSRYGQANSYHADDAAIERGGFGTNARYAEGYLTDALIDMMNEFYVETGAWLDNGDGTATYSTTGEVTIMGVDGIAGTEDDNEIINPAGTVLLTDVTAEYDEEGNVYVDLGNDFQLTAGDDGLIGTRDDVVYFGAFNQSEHDDGMLTPLAWLVLNIDGDEAMLVTEEIVDGVQFNLSDEDGNEWADSNLRAWLNSTGGVDLLGDTVGFYDTAFTDDEKEKIELTDVCMNYEGTYYAYNRLLDSDWWCEYTTTGTDTEDYVFALSAEEVWEYFGNSPIATLEELGHDPMYYTYGMSTATPYAVMAGVAVNGGGNGLSYIGYADSWTRSPGAIDETGETSCGVFLGSVGSLNSGRSVTRGYGARPAINVSLAG